MDKKGGEIYKTIINNESSPLNFLLPRIKTKEKKEVYQVRNLPHYKYVDLKFDPDKSTLYVRIIYSSEGEKILGREYGEYIFNFQEKKIIEMLTYKKEKLVRALIGSANSYEESCNKYNIFQYVKGRLGEIVMNIILDEFLLYLWLIYGDKNMEIVDINTILGKNGRIEHNSRGSYNILNSHIFYEVDYFTPFKISNNGKDKNIYLIGEAKTGKGFMIDKSLKKYISCQSKKLTHIKNMLIEEGKMENEIYYLVMAPAQVIYRNSKKRVYNHISTELYHSLREKGIHFIAIPFSMNKHNATRLFKEVSTLITKYIVSNWLLLLMDKLEFKRIDATTPLEEIIEAWKEERLYMITSKR